MLLKEGIGIKIYIIYTFIKIQEEIQLPVGLVACFCGSFQRLTDCLLPQLVGSRKGVVISWLRQADWLALHVQEE